MSTITASSLAATSDRGQPGYGLAASITWAASKQTFFTIRFLADRERAGDAYRAYGYFRWVDDTLDEGGLNGRERAAFVARQNRLIDRCYWGDWPDRVSPEEEMLVDLIRSDTEPNSGLQAYVREMMAVMAFDAGRRGRLISAAELARYTRWLSVGVAEAVYHFIGHGSRSPQGEARYLAVTGAHITHMLRDTFEDAEAGYFNIPREIVEAGGIDPHNAGSEPYRAWVKSRVRQARRCFEAGHEAIRQIESARCRLATAAYMARFEGVLDAIEREDYRLRAAYPERKSPAAGLRMVRSALAGAFSAPNPHKARRIFRVRWG